MKKIFLIYLFCVAIVLNYTSKPMLYTNLGTDVSRDWLEYLGLSNNTNSRIESAVSNMKVTSDGKLVTIAWDGVVEENLAYKVYRSNAPITNRTALNDNSLEIYFTLSENSASRQFHTFDVPPESGFYYYAIASLYTIENSAIVPVVFKAEPNVDMTIEPIIIDMRELPSQASFDEVEQNIEINTEAINPFVPTIDTNAAEAVVDVVEVPVVPEVVVAPVVPVIPEVIEPRYIKGIATRLYSGNNVAISWDIVVGDNVEYTVYRSNVPVINESIRNRSSKVASTGNSFVNDRLNAEVDTYYYVTSNKSDDDVFVAGENYTTVAVEPTIQRYRQAREETVDGNRFIYYKVNSLTSSIQDGKAVLEWKDPNGLPNNEYHYLLFTSTNNFYTGQNVITDSFLSMAKKVVPSEIEKNNFGTVRYVDEDAITMTDLPIYHSIVIVANGSVPTVVLGSGMYTESPIVLSEVEEVPHVQEPEVEEEVQAEPKAEVVPEEVVGDVAVEEESTPEIEIEPEPLIEEKPPVKEVVKKVEPVRPIIKDPLAETKELYSKASAEFNKKNYRDVKKLLEGKKIPTTNEKLYYNTNLILAISYYRLNDKKKALSTLKNIRDISPSEVDFWVGQILGDL